MTTNVAGWDNRIYILCFHGSGVQAVVSSSGAITRVLSGLWPPRLGVPFQARHVVGKSDLPDCSPDCRAKVSHQVGLPSQHPPVLAMWPSEIMAAYFFKASTKILLYCVMRKSQSNPFIVRVPVHSLGKKIIQSMCINGWNLWGQFRILSTININNFHF